MCKFVCSYLGVMVEFETYYGSSPHKPVWVRAFHDEMAKMKLKKLPIIDTNVHEQFKKYFGYKKAVKYKVGSGDGRVLDLNSVLAEHIETFLFLNFSNFIYDYNYIIVLFSMNDLILY